MAGYNEPPKMQAPPQYGQEGASQGFYNQPQGQNYYGYQGQAAASHGQTYDPSAGGYYPQGGPPHPQQQYHQPYSEKPSYTNVENQPKAKWNDLFFAILFIAQFCAYIAVSVIALRAYSSGNDVGSGLGGTGGNSATLNSNTAYLLCLIAACGFLFSLIFLFLIKKFTRAILEICLLISLVVTIAYAIYLWVRRYYSGAIIFTVFAIIYIIAYFPMRKRIPLSKALLQTILRVCDMYKSTYFIAIMFTILQGAYSVWWSFTVTAAYQKWSPGGGATNEGGGSSGSGSIICAVIFLVFSYYWTTQVITNLCLTTEAGIFGTWYFTGGKEAGTQAPVKVARGALKRACTFSFGSICFGSLIVALLDLIRSALSVARQEAASQGDILAVICTCIAQCCVACIQWAVEFFNRYAYIEIALYGKPYMQAAKDTWHLFKDRGIDALINDCLVGNIATIFSYVSGAICSAFAFLYLRILTPDYIDDNSNYTAVIMLFAFLIGFMISYALLYGALSAGVSTLFVGLAENPAALAERDPALYQHIASVYPKVTTSV